MPLTPRRWWPLEWAIDAIDLVVLPHHADREAVLDRAGLESRASVEDLQRGVRERQYVVRPRP
eukprot:3690349-Pyramimonas_sp.AAC.1